MMSRVSARGLWKPQHSQMPQLVMDGSTTASARVQTDNATRSDPRIRPARCSYWSTAARADPDRLPPPTFGLRSGVVARAINCASARSWEGRLRGMSLRGGVHAAIVGARKEPRPSVTVRPRTDSRASGQLRPASRAPARSLRDGLRPPLVRTSADLLCGRASVQAAAIPCSLDRGHGRRPSKPPLPPRRAPPAEPAAVGPFVVTRSC